MGSGIYGEMTLEEIAAVLGGTRERIRQIEARALYKVRRQFVLKRIKKEMYEFLQPDRYNWLPSRNCRRVKRCHMLHELDRDRSHL